MGLALLTPCLMASEAEWRVDRISLTPGNDSAGQLSVGVSSVSGAFEIVSEVPLTKVTDNFVFRDRLVVMGNYGRAFAVAIFDLTSRKALDWFGCREAVRISQSWIASVEWYPEHGMRWPTDVVLIYDLEKTPGQNRLLNAEVPSTLPPISDLPIAVGFPVYPTANALEESFRNVVPSAGAAVSILGAPYFTLLSSRLLVFVAAQGKDYPSSENHLVVVDLSHGLLRPPARVVEIPKASFTKFGHNPKMTQILRMEGVGEHSVRLFLPQSEYGVASEVVDLSMGTPE